MINLILFHFSWMNVTTPVPPDPPYMHARMHTRTHAHTHPHSHPLPDLTLPFPTTTDHWNWILFSFSGVLEIFLLWLSTETAHYFLLGVLEKVGVEPQIQRIGKYKSAGDQLARKSMSKEVCEMLTSLLDNIYGNWLDTISCTRGELICLLQ